MGINKHGGKRPNSGRKKGSVKEKTKQIRVPESLMPTVKEMIIRHKSKGEN